MNYSQLTQSIRFRFEQFLNSLSTFQMVVFWSASALLTISACVLLWFASQLFTIDAPAKGGTLNEGAVGYPHYINPLLSFTNTGKDIGKLVYAGLLKRDQHGNLIPDMAESIEESADGKMYTVHLKKNLKFHDGTALTSEDVAFTINRALDVTLKSPETGKWQGVTVETPDAETIIFTLKTPFRPFLDSLTLGILPKHIWNDLDTDQFNLGTYNIEPIGSGPYRFASIDRDEEGNPKSYHVEAFDDYALGEPYIQDIVFTFYDTKDEMLAAYKNEEIDSMQGLSAEAAMRARSMIEGRDGVILSLPQPRLFGIFFGQGTNQLVLKDVKIRQALSLAINRQDLIEKSISGFGHVENGPIPSAFFPALSVPQPSLANTASSTIETSTSSVNNANQPESTRVNTVGSSEAWYDVSKAVELLSQAGYERADGILVKKGTNTKLSLTLSTVSGSELEEAAVYIQESWKALGIDVTLQTYDPSEISQKIIRGRNFDALLFGLVVPTSLDLYPFWHSSERKDPGANISMYSNRSVDDWLVDIRTSTSSPDEALRGVQSAIQTDLPAVFLFSPSYIYVIPEYMQGEYQGGITEPFDRFTNIVTTSVKTEQIWPIFKQKESTEVK